MLQRVQPEVLERLHADHKGIERCKSASKVLHLLGRHQHKPGRNGETLPNVPRTPKIQCKGNSDALRGTNEGMSNTRHISLSLQRQ